MSNFQFASLRFRAGRVAALAVAMLFAAVTGQPFRAVAQDAPALAETGLPRVSSGVMEAMVISKVPPAYPEMARQAHVQGAVVLRGVVDESGAVVNLVVVSGPEMLRAAAMESVRQWTYRPYLLNGKPTAVETTMTVNFAISG